MKEEERKILEPYFPIETVDMVIACFEKFYFHLRIANPRKVHLGTFIPNIKDKSKPHKIILNKDLGKYTFFLVFIHELAHLLVWNQYGRAAKPHGQEWKAEFKGMLDTIVAQKLLPNELTLFLQKKMLAAISASHRNPELLRILQKLEGKGARRVVSDAPENTVFTTMQGRKFLKLEKRRTRFKCQCVESKQYYLVSGQLEIIAEEQ